MLKFLKKLLQQEEEVKEESLHIDQLEEWLEKKSKPIYEEMRNGVDQIIESIGKVQEKARENIKQLQKAGLQNPNIPNKAKTVMEGNREAFLKKTSHFFDTIDFEYKTFDEVIEKCKTLEKDVDALAESTSKSYSILNQFFGREVAHISNSIKKIDTLAKDIKNLFEYKNKADLDKIKENSKDLQHKIKSKKTLSLELDKEQKKLEEKKLKVQEKEKNIKDIKEGEEYKEYQDLIVQKAAQITGLKEIEDKLFHDFSDLEKAMKKYSKIAFEHGDWIEDYLKNSLHTLQKDSELRIVTILNNLEQALKKNTLDLDEKKSQRAIMKIKELGMNYFENLQKRYTSIKNTLEDVEQKIENNTVRKELDMLNEEIKIIENGIETLQNKIHSLKGDRDKINIDQLKQDLQNLISRTLHTRITLL